MQYQDLTEVFQIADAIWGPDYHESQAVYEDKFLYHPPGCQVYQVKHLILGYVVAHPWRYGMPPLLDTVLDRTVITDSYHIHDIVLDTSLRGQGVSKLVVNQILANNQIVTLAAANRSTQTKNIWQHFGFVETGIKCDYGVYMSTLL